MTCCPNCGTSWDKHTTSACQLPIVTDQIVRQLDEIEKLRAEVEDAKRNQAAACLTMQKQADLYNQENIRLRELLKGATTGLNVKEAKGDSQTKTPRTDALCKRCDSFEQFIMEYEKLEIEFNSLKEKVNQNNTGEKQ